MPIPYRIARRLINPLSASFLDQRPAARLIRDSAKRSWRLIVLNSSTSLAASLSEGATLGVIFLAVSLISHPQSSDWNSISFLAPLRHLPRTATVRGITETVLLVLDGNQFVAAVASHTSSADSAEAMVAGRLAGIGRARRGRGH